MISAQINKTYIATVEGMPPNAEGTVSAQVFNPIDNTVVTVEFTEGITEAGAGSGIYTVVMPTIDTTGNYLLVWNPNTDGFDQKSEPVLVVTGPPSEMIPTLEDMGDLLFSRTTGRGGSVGSGSFSETTTPTASRVERFVRRSYMHIIGLTGPVTEENSDQFEDFKNVVMYHAGMLIELSMERTNKERFDGLKEMYDQSIASLIESLGGEGTSAADDTLPVSANSPVYSFPSSDREIGLGTNW